MHKPYTSSSEVSIGTTLFRTVILLGLTLAFMAVFRFCKPVIHIMQNVAGSSAWQSLYGFFHIGSGLGREQFLLTAIMLLCFALALLAQAAGMIIWRRMRPRVKS